MRSRVDSNTASRLQPLLPDHVWRRSLPQHQATLWSQGPPLGIAMGDTPGIQESPPGPKAAKTIYSYKDRIEYFSCFLLGDWVLKDQEIPNRASCNQAIWRQSGLQQKLRRRNSSSLLRILRHPHLWKMTLKFFRLLGNLLHPPLHRRRLRHHHVR